MGKVPSIPCRLIWATFFGGAYPTTNFIVRYGEKPFIHNPYGSKVASSYGVAVQIQRVTKRYLILDFQLGTELLRSRVTINNIGSVSVGLKDAAKGRGVLSMGRLNLYPRIGRRFLLHSSTIDLTVGPELGLTMSSWERGIAEDKALKLTYITDYKISEPDTNLSIRSALTEYWRKWVLSVGYS